MKVNLVVEKKNIFWFDLEAFPFPRPKICCLFSRKIMANAQFKLPDDKAENLPPRGQLIKNYDQEGLFMLSGYNVNKPASAVGQRLTSKFFDAGSEQAQRKLWEIAEAEAERRVEKESKLFGKNTSDMFFFHLDYAMAAVVEQREKGNDFPTPEDLGHVNSSKGRQL